ncbi:MAG: PDZ domain-containing protein [Candidatus Rokubacteria bacterium]|nr:PDZ domain-containing protein [Candidatus Rokubacteria bacterium]
MDRAFGVEAREGALVSSVRPGSPAQRAGIERGDVIVEYDGQKVGPSSSLPRMVATTRPGTKVGLVVLRDGKRVPLEVTVTRMEEPDTSAAVKSEETGKLGLTVQPLAPEEAARLGLDEQRGVVVRSVEPRTPAARAGIQVEDVIVEVNGKPVKDAADLQRALDKRGEGAANVFLMQRDGQSVFVAVPSA